MPPRKAPTTTKASSGKTVRRVVRTITTEHVIEEELVQNPTTTTPKASKTSKTIKKQPTSKRGSAKSEKTATPQSNAKTSKSTPSKTSKPTAKSSKPSTTKKASTTTSTKQASTKSSSKKEVPKTTSSKVKKKPNESLRPQPVIKKTSARKPTKAAASKASASNPAATPAAYAKILNDAMETARQAAQEEWKKLTAAPVPSSSTVPTKTKQTARKTGSKTLGSSQNPSQEAMPDLVEPSSCGFMLVSGQNSVPSSSIARRTGVTAVRAKNESKQVSRPSRASSSTRTPIKRTARKSANKTESRLQKPQPITVPGLETGLTSTAPKNESSLSNLLQASNSASRAAPIMSRARRVKQTARRTTSARAMMLLPTSSSSPPRSEENGQYTWRLTNETGFVPDGFHSYMEPTKRDLGVFSTRTAAVQRGMQAIGEAVGFSWDEVQEAGDLETIRDSQLAWEMCWSPPDSEYSRVTVQRICTTAGRWIVEVESGYPADGFHSYNPPTRKQHGPYENRERAVAIGKRCVGQVYGIPWSEVVSGGELDVRADCSTKWEVYWSPPDSEYAHVTVRRLPDVGDSKGTNNSRGGGDSASGWDESEDDEMIMF